MEFIGHFRRLTPVQRNTFIACFLGWSLDAFDFFILTFCVSAIATQFQSKISSVVSLRSRFDLMGGIVFGTWSETIGRRKAIVIAALLTIPIARLWAYSHTVPMLALGGFLMQFLVQGAWGVIPAHLNELSPPAVRGTFPGLAYQLGNSLSSWNGVKQARVAEQHYGGVFAPVLAWTVLIVALLVAVVTGSGHERRGADLSNTI